MTDETDDAIAASADEDPVTAWLKRNLSWLAIGFALIFFVLPYVSPFGGLNQFLNYPHKFSEWTLRKLQHLFSDYGYYVVFFGVLMEKTLFLGLLVPGSVILVLGGLSAQNGSINVWFVLGLGIVATIIGDNISYLVGRMGWVKLLHSFGMAEMIEKARGTIESNGWFIIGYHFAGYTRLVGPPAAGMFRVPYRRWALLDHTGGTLWVIAFTSLGVVLGLFGLDFGDTKRMSRFLELFFTALIISGVAIAWYRTSRASSRASESATAMGIDEH